MHILRGAHAVIHNSPSLVGASGGGRQQVIMRGESDFSRRCGVRATVAPFLDRAAVNAF
jgi:hypothetical protein